MADIATKIKITKGLAPLFTRARAEGLWFHCSYHDLWLSPDELEARQANGQFRWGVANWTLRDPQERVRQLEAACSDSGSALASFKKRL